MSSIQPSVKHSLLKYPYGHFTIAATTELLLVVFLSPSLLYGISFSYEHNQGIGPAMVFPDPRTKIPFLPTTLLLTAGAILLLCKRKIGMYLSLAGLLSFSTYFAIYPNIMFGHIGRLNLHYLLFLPFTLAPLVPLFYGWKKVKW